jgi:hypothetical protein
MTLGPNVLQTFRQPDHPFKSELQVGRPRICAHIIHGGARSMTGAASTSSIASALRRAPEKTLPLTTEAFERSLELIPGELPPEGLKAYGRAKRAVLVNSSVDVGRIKLKPRLT